jgi:site-specific DNA recombinase
MNAKRLRAAYYARYSTDGQEADSIDRQFMVCHAIAKREGFLHADRHRFSDPETSGGTPRRVGYSAMRAAAMRGEFDVLVAEDISRLWRNMEMQTRDINELLELRISIVTQAEDTRRENDLMMLNLKGAMNENNRKEIGRRVRNKMELLAKNGRPARRSRLRLHPSESERHGPNRDSRGAGRHRPPDIRVARGRMER